MELEFSSAIRAHLKVCALKYAKKYEAGTLRRAPDRGEGLWRENVAVLEECKKVAAKSDKLQRCPSRSDDPKRRWSDEVGGAANTPAM